MLADEALAALRQPRAEPDDASGRIAVARFFAENVAVQAAGLAGSVVDGYGALEKAAFDAAFE